MRIPLITVTLLTFVSSVSVTGLSSSAAQSRDVGLNICESIYSVLPYPRTVTNTTVIGSSPLRVRVDLLARSTSKSIPFSVEGMVCQAGFDQQAANAACRSLNFNRAVYVTNLEWQAPLSGSGKECIMDTGVYKSVIPCEFVLHQLRCPIWSTRLMDCSYAPLYTQSVSCNRYSHIGLICT